MTGATIILGAGESGTNSTQQRTTKGISRRRRITESTDPIPAAGVAGEVVIGEAAEEDGESDEARAETSKTEMQANLKARRFNFGLLFNV
mmetsp:Transcript_29738/g.72443  ORF Transcript_29738/g.72443 Transcript_29738/m.72443 type:complete len:90 (-) Transcript_29738:36-305(-)